jgi:hypothetical protein
MVTFYDNEDRAQTFLPKKARFISLFLYQAEKRGYIGWSKQPEVLNLPDFISEDYFHESRSIFTYFYNFNHIPQPIILSGVLPVEHPDSLKLTRYLKAINFNS